MDELTIAFKIESPPSWLPIGRTAENNWRTVEIDCSYWFNMSADGEVVLMYKPSCGMSPYPLLTEREGDNIIWRPKSGELVEGVGRLQAFFEVGTDVIGSSDMISCEVDSSLLGVEPGTDPGQTELPWALDIIEQIAELSGHYPKIVNGVLYVWDSEQEDWVQFQGGGSAENAVLYTPQSLTDSQKAQARTNVGAGTYSKPSGGIPASDLASAVQTSLGKADTALQQHQSLTGYATETWVEGKGYQTASDVNTKIDNLRLSFGDTVERTRIILSLNAGILAANLASFDEGGGGVADFAAAYFAGKNALFLLQASYVDPSNTSGMLSFEIVGADTNTAQSTYLRIVSNYAGKVYAATLRPVSANVMQGQFEILDYQTAQDVQTAINGVRQLPTVSATDNGKFLRVSNGAWAAETVQTWQGGSY